MSDTAEQVAALERRMAGASSVDSVSVDKALLAELCEGWRCWQRVEAMPEGSLLLNASIGNMTHWEAYKWADAEYLYDARYAIYATLVGAAPMNADGYPGEDELYDTAQEALIALAAAREEGTDGE